MSSDLAQEVRRVRHERGMSIEALAFKAGVSVSTVNRVESDKHSPSIATLTRIAEALDVELGDLLGVTPKAAS